MSDVSYYRADQEAEWLAHRRRRLTASELGAVLGLSEYMDASTVQAIKRQQITSGIDPARARIGHDAEEFVARQFLARHGEYQASIAYHDNDVTPFANALHEDADSVLSCTPDRVLDKRIECPESGLIAWDGEAAGLECKTAATQTRPWEWEEPPPSYVVQCLVGLACTGWSEWWLAVCWDFTPGGYREWRLTAADYAGQIPRLRMAANNWWQKHIIEGADIEPTGPNAVAIIGARPKNSPLLVQPDDDERVTIEHLRDWTRARTLSAAQVALFRTELAKSLDRRSVQGFRWDTGDGEETIRFDERGILRANFKREKHGT